MARDLHNIPIKLYSQFHELMPIICVDIVINIENKILLVKRDKEPELGRWWFPGGRLLRGESLKSAVNRISKAETGISIFGLYFLGHDETIFNTAPFNHGNGTHTINFVFAARAKMVPIVLDDNHTAYSTLTFEEIYGSDVHSYIKKFTALTEVVDGIF